MILLMRGFRTRKRIVRRKSRIQRGGDIVSEMENRLNFFKEYDSLELKTEIKTIKQEVREKETHAKSVSVSVSGTTTFKYTTKEDIQSPFSDVNDSIITFVDCHGSIDDNDSATTLVPPNTILCFMSPLGTLDYVVNRGITYTILEEFLGSSKKNGLTSEKYKYIMENRIGINEFLSLEYEEHSCFAHSMWYYPGQIYPDCILSISDSDINFNKLKQYPFQFSAVDITLDGPKPNCKLNLNNSFFSDFNPVTTYLQTHNKIETNLSKSINQLPLDYNTLRLVILTICRPFYNLDKTKRLNTMKREIYYYHMNKQLLSKVPEDNKLISKCYQFTNKYILLRDRESGSGSGVSDSDILHQFESNKKHSMSGKIPGLMKLKEIIGSGTITEIQSTYLHDFSIIKIIKFLKLWEGNFKTQLTSFLKHSLQIPELVNKINCLGNFITQNIGLLNQIDVNIIYEFREVINILMNEPKLKSKKKKWFYSNKSIILWNHNLKLFKNLSRHVITIDKLLKNRLDLAEINFEINVIDSKNIEDYAENPYDKLVLECSSLTVKNTLKVLIPINLEESNLQNVNTSEMVFTKVSKNIIINNSYLKDLDLTCLNSGMNYRINLNCPHLQTLRLTNFNYQSLIISINRVRELYLKDCNFKRCVIPPGSTPLSLMIDGDIQSRLFEKLCELPQVYELVLESDFTFGGLEKKGISLFNWINSVKNPNLKFLEIKSKFVKVNLDELNTRYATKNKIKIVLDIPQENIFKLSDSDNFEIINNGTLTIVSSA